MPISSDAQIVEGVQQAFATCTRPEHFTNHMHREECAEHDEVLRTRDIETLSIEDAGNPGWDAICFISQVGFGYYFPALARLALAQPVGPHGWYAPQLLFHLCNDGRLNERILGCTPEQRRSIVDLLHHILETRADFADSSLCAGELLDAIEYWSDASGRLTNPESV